MESIHTTRGAFYRGFWPLLSIPTNFSPSLSSHSPILSFSPTLSSLFFFSTPPLNLGFPSLPSIQSLSPSQDLLSSLLSIISPSSPQSSSLISPWIKISSSQPDRLSSPRIGSSSLFFIFSSSSNLFLSILNSFLFSCNGFAIFLLCV